MKEMFRDLRADEIDCRVSTCSEKGVSLLLYKDARCDMNILDETVGPMNWKRSHTRDNANCIVSLYDCEKKEWVSKEDTGTESNTEKEKGLASDSFKRACFNWGIGRELYTAPFIWISAGCVNVSKDPNRAGKYTTKDRFRVNQMTVKDKKITSLVIENVTQKREVFRYGKQNDVNNNQENQGIGEISDVDVSAMRNYIKSNGLNEKTICALYKKTELKSLTFKEFQNVLDPKYLDYWKQKCGAA